VKSDCSIGYGTDSIDDLVAGAARRGYQVLALTDLENLYCQVRFHHQCRSSGIRPLTGLELRPGFNGRREPGSRRGRIVLLAADRTGYGNLCRIVSIRRGALGACAGHGVAGADPLPLVQRHPGGLYALSDDPEVIGRLLQTAFPRERIGLLLVRPDPQSDDAERRAVAARLGVRLVADTDTVFLDPDGHPLHLLQLAIRQGLLLEQLRTAGAESPERFLRSASEAAALFDDVPAALEAAREIADACRLDLGAIEVPAPGIGLARELAAARLRELCERSIPVAYREAGAWSAVHAARLEEELALFEELNFTGFLLVVGEILSHCRTEGIPAAVRGSAVSSLTLHLLGGSPVDPLKHGLMFERFLHPGKTAWPDVDIDLPWQRRDAVIEWVYRRFGEDRVAMVASLHTFQVRSALREGLKALGVQASAIEALSRALPPEDLVAAEDVDFLGLASVADASRPVAAADSLPGEGAGFQAALKLARRLVGRPRHVAVHPGGIVVGGGSLRQLLPLELARKGVVITQYDLVAVARLGLAKIDLLGNRCLAELAEVLEHAGYPKTLGLEAFPAEDRHTLELIDRADTIGCFQLESPAMRALLKRLPIRKQSDLTAALALIRPGAASGDVKMEFIRRARGEAREPSAFSLLADRLSETHGLFLYEEDIMLLLSRAGGLSLGEADELRREIVHSGGDLAVMAGLRARFLERAASRGGTPAVVSRAWTFAARFAAYSFNKAHAASFALLAYYSAYTKAHHPVQFAAALLNHHEGMYPLRTEAAELIRMGVELHGPQVNLSGVHSRCEPGEDGLENAAVRVGLDRVKVLSRRAVEELLGAREKEGAFQNLRDLVERVRLKPAELQSLILCGACDGLAPLAAADFPFAHEAAWELLRSGGPPESLDDLPVPRPVDLQFDHVRLYQALVRVKHELRYLEMHLSGHPVALLRPRAACYGCSTVQEAGKLAGGAAVRLLVLVAALRRVRTSQGPLQFMSLEDETGLLETVLLPAEYRRIGEIVGTPGPFLVQGRVRREHDAVHLELTRMVPFHERLKP